MAVVYRDYMKSIHGTLVVEKDIKNRAFVILSGGLDSTLAAHEANMQFSEVIPLFFDWGQKAVKEEWQAARNVAARLGINCPVRITIPLNLWDVSVLTQGDPNQALGNIVVMERNLVFISVAASYARSHGGGLLVVGFNKDDAGYDTTGTFVDLVNAVFDQGNKDLEAKRIGLNAPLIEMDKGMIKEELRVLGLFDLTYSCYAANGPCNECIACRKRNR